MSCSPLKCKEDIKSLAAEAGFYAVGFADAEPVDASVTEYYGKWIAEGKNADMAYLANHAEIRRDPRLLLDGAKTVIVLAMSYFHKVGEGENLCNFALYAHGDDYHEVLRERLKPIVQYIENQGFEARVCVDSAPILERYWAVRAGVGFQGRNSMLIVPGAGSYFFLCEIVTSLALPADEPCTLSCGDCMACVKHCPGAAIENRHIDARKCHSYLTIEHRGNLPANLSLRGIYGCDECQKCCPHNAAPPFTPLSVFHLRPALSSLTPQAVLSLTQPEFSAIFTHSAVKRTKLAGLQRNAIKLGRFNNFI